MSQFVYKRQSIDDLVPGMILGKMLVTTDGKVFLNEGAELTLRVIQSLQLWGFNYVDIRLEVDDEVLPEIINKPADHTGLADGADSATNAKGTVTPAGRYSGGVAAETANDVPEKFALYYQAAVQILKKHLAKVRFIKDGFDVAEIKQTVAECIMPLLDDHAVTDSLQMIPHNEDYLYHHSVDVGIIAGCLSLWLGHSYHEIEETVLGALLHDVGKALIPLKVLNKPGVLTAEELHLVQFHPTRGYKFLKQYNSDLSRNVLLCVLQHHERLDGTGYPLGVKADKIHPYAKIIAVADVFDAITSVRSYGRRVTPYEGVEMMRHEMVGKLDTEICAMFFNRLSQRFVGNRVQLSDGQCGEVIFLNSNDCTRPIIRTADGGFVDLEKRRELSICKMLHS